MIGPVGLYLRRYLDESNVFLELRTGNQESKFVKAIAAHFKELLVCIGLYSGGTISFYVILLYMPTFATTQLHLPLSEALVAQSICLGWFALLVPLSGALSDRIGRKPILLAAFLPYLSLAYPLFAWVHANPSFTNLLIMQGALCSFLGAFFGPFATVLAEQFPVHIALLQHYFQRRGHGIRRLRAVLCHMVDRSHRFAHRAGVLRDVWTCNKCRVGLVYC
jgi:MFS transporter, MHS family, proline/betaine transporter